MAGHALDAAESPLIPDLSLSAPRGAIALPGWRCIARCAAARRRMAPRTVRRAHGDTAVFLALLALVATLGATALTVALGVGEPTRVLAADGFGDDGGSGLIVGPIDHARFGVSGLPSWRDR